MTQSLLEIPVAAGSVEYRGVLETVTTEAGVLPRRLPEWTVAQYADLSMERQATAGSGVRLAFRTAATVVELDVLTTVPMMQEGEPNPDDAGVFVLTVDGEAVRTVKAPVGNVILLDAAYQQAGFVEGTVATVRFDGLPAAEKDVEIWLPQWVKTEVVALRTDAVVERQVPSGRRVWVHHGSSISQCNEADSPLGVWPVIAAGLGGVDVVNVGLAGNSFLDPFVARSIRNAPADVISLKLGINFTARSAFRLRTLGPAVHGFLDTIRDGHPDTPLLVVSSIACRAVEEASGPTRWVDGVLRPIDKDLETDLAFGALTLRRVREELRRIVELRAKQDPNIFYLDGLELLDVPETDEFLSEGLHPNPAGYRLIGERFARLAFGSGGALAAKG